MKKIDLFNDVKQFHLHFKLFPVGNGPHKQEISGLRLKHLQEELGEICEAMVMEDRVRLLDGLIDLVYVALGGAYLLGLPFNKGWKLVHAANMKKIRAARKDQSKRGSTFDVVKPAGWRSPEPALAKLVARHTIKGKGR